MSIINFPKPERLIFTCGHCGCSTFYLYDDETIECAGCNFKSNGGEWVTPLQSHSKSPEKDNSGSVDMIAIGSIEFARRRVVKRIMDEQSDLAFVAGWFEEGGMTSWSGAETEEQKDWTVRKLRELADAIALKTMP